MSLPLGGAEHIAAVKNHTRRISRILAISAISIVTISTIIYLLIHQTSPPNEHLLGALAVLLFGVVLFDLVALYSLFGAHRDLKEELAIQKNIGRIIPESHRETSSES